MNPDNPLSELNEEDKEKALEYISLLVDSGKYAPEKATIIPFTRVIKLFDIYASPGMKLAIFISLLFYATLPIPFPPVI